MADLDNAFEIAAANARNLLDDPQGDAQLELYGYYRQASDGDNHTPQPGAQDTAALAKWNAWSARAGMSREHAKQQYVTLISAIG